MTLISGPELPDDLGWCDRPPTREQLTRASKHAFFYSERLPKDGT